MSSRLPAPSASPLLRWELALSRSRMIMMPTLLVPHPSPHRHPVSDHTIDGITISSSRERPYHHFGGALARLAPKAPMSAVLSAIRPLVESSPLGKRRPERQQAPRRVAPLGKRRHERMHARGLSLKDLVSAVLSGDRSSRAEAASDTERHRAPTSDNERGQATPPMGLGPPASSVHTPSTNKWAACCAC